MTEPRTKNSLSTEEHLLRIISALKDRIDSIEPQTSLAMHFSDSKFNPGPFYACKYGKLVESVEQITSQVKNGKRIEEITL